MGDQTVKENKKTTMVYSDEHVMFRDSLRRFLEKEAVPYFEQWEEDCIIPRTFWRKMGGNGFICPWVSEEYGGQGTDFGFSAILNCVFWNLLMD